MAILLPSTSVGAQAQAADTGNTQPSAQPDYVPGELLVRFQKGVAPRVVDQQVQVGAASLDGLLQQYGVTAAEKVFSEAVSSNTGMDRIYKLSFAPDADMLSLLASLNADRAIEFAEPNYLYYTQQTTDTPPSDRLYAYQWGLYNPRSASGDTRIDLHAPEAWRITTGAADLLIAVIDTGIDYTHEDLSDGRVRTDIDKDYVNRDDDAMDDQGHGTHVAGTIAAATNNAVGGAGVMWQAQLLPLKVCSESGGCSTEHIVQAIEYAADNGARVINMSLGGDSCSETLEAAVDYAYFEKGVVIVAAAGNSNDLVGYPAAYEPVIAVGAVDRHGSRAFFSSYGEPLDVVAPGVRVFSTVLA
ncbi:MAG: S8 family serine peptidase [Caldilineaceae bacterium]